MEITFETRVYDLLTIGLQKGFDFASEAKEFAAPLRDAMAEAGWWVNFEVRDGRTFVESFGKSGVPHSETKKWGIPPEIGEFALNITVELPWYFGLIKRYPSPMGNLVLIASFEE
jgi:hypothetical protein